MRMMSARRAINMALPGPSEALSARIIWTVAAACGVIDVSLGPRRTTRANTAVLRRTAPRPSGTRSGSPSSSCGALDIYPGFVTIDRPKRLQHIRREEQAPHRPPSRTPTLMTHPDSDIGLLIL